MAKQPAAQQPLSGFGETELSVIDDLFNLAASRNLDVLLGKALRVAIRALNAEAGSVLVKVHNFKHARSGAFRGQALAHIQHWEDVVSQRLQKTTWTMPSDSPPAISELNLAGGQLVLVSTPVLQGPNVVGLLSLVLPPGSALAKSERAWLAQIARGLGQIASLMSQLEQVQHRLSRINVFFELGRALVTTFDITTLLSETMELATNIIDAGAASIMLIDEEKKDLVFKVSHGNTGHILRQQRIPMDEGIAGWVAQHGRPVIANDARADARFSHRVDVRTGFLTQSIAAVPLEIKGRVIGVLEVLNKYSSTGFSEEDVQLMTSIANQAAIAIENARLYQKVRDERDAIVGAQETFRQELARRMTDGPIQLLSAISMSVDHLEQLNIKANPEIVQNEIGALRNLIQQANRDARKLLFDLNPPILETQGLLPAIEHQLNQLRESLNVHYQPVTRADYNAKTAGAIFSIVQEAIKNVKRHANAQNLWLQLNVNNGRFIATVRDDGQGFAPNQVDHQSCFGLMHMREQASLIGAELNVRSRTEAPNRGTYVQLAVPYPLQGDARKI